MHIMNCCVMAARLQLFCDIRLFYFISSYKKWIFFSIQNRIQRIDDMHSTSRSYIYYILARIRAEWNLLHLYNIAVARHKIWEWFFSPYLIFITACNGAIAQHTHTNNVLHFNPYVNCNLYYIENNFSIIIARYLWFETNFVLNMNRLFDSGKNHIGRMVLKLI